MRFTLEIEQEEDGRWIVEIPELSGVAYGDTREAAVAKAKILASVRTAPGENSV